MCLRFRNRPSCKPPPTSKFRPRSFPGFTLLELLVVIVIIGLLAGLVAPRYFDTVGKSKSKVARAQMDSLEKALDQYRLDVGAFPSTEQGLNSLITQPNGIAKWQGPYLKKAVPLDPWGNPYVYKLMESGREIDIISLGSDGQTANSSEELIAALWRAGGSNLARFPNCLHSHGRRADLDALVAAHGEQIGIPGDDQRCAGCD